MVEKPKRPGIRFKGFEGDWEERKLNRFSEYQPSRYSANQFAVLETTGNYPVFDANNQITCLDKYDQESEYISIIKDGAGVGRVALRPGKSSIIGTMGYILPRESDLYFLFNVIQKIDFNKYISGSTIPHVYYRDYGNMEFFVPTIKEQDTIGKLFQHLDNLITLHQRKYEKLQNLKKSCLEKMFPKSGSNIPELRFNGFSDAWEERKLGEVVVRVVRKNTDLESTLPLTISAQYGLVDQITYFNNRVASNNVSNYYLVVNGEFAYNKSSSDGFPFGAVKRLDLYKNGVLSTLYIVFSIKNTELTNSDFLTVFFDTDRWHKGVSERAAEGARNHGLLNISADDFFDIDLYLPSSNAEQIKIGNFFSNLDKLITLQQRKLQKLQNLKKACLEKMFV